MVKDGVTEMQEVCAEGAWGVFSGRRTRRIERDCGLFLWPTKSWLVESKVVRKWGGERRPRVMTNCDTGMIGKASK